MTFELLIELEGIEPKIWRKIRVPADLTMREFHHTIQITMGWENCHLYKFEANGEVITQLDFIEDDDFFEDHEVQLDEYLSDEGDTLLYTYDFGDAWKHTVTLQKRVENDESAHLPICLEGKRNCPPEDVGSIKGYENFLKVMANPKLPEHEEMLDWYGGEYDPEQYRMEIVNEDLEGLDDYIDSFGDDWLHI